MLLSASSVVLAGLGAVALAVSIRAIWRRWHRRAVVVVVPLFAASLVEVVFSVGGHLVIAMGLLLSLLLLAAPHGLQTSLPQQPRPSLTPHLVALALIGWLCFREVISPTAQAGAVVGYTASAGFVLVCVLLSRSGGVRKEDLSNLLLAYLSFGMLYSAFVGTSWAPCQPSKCTPVGELYRAGFPTENTAALLAGLVLLLGIGRPSERRGLAILTGIVVLYASGGRTGLAAVVGAVAIAALLSLFAPPRLNGELIRARRALAYGIAGAAAAGALWVAAHSTSSNFSNRGRIWQAALDLVPASSMAGRRVSDWEVLRVEGVIPDHSAHSLYVHVFFGGGLVALGLLALMFGSLLVTRRASTRRDLWLAIVPVVFVMVSGLTEVVWNPATLDSLAILLLPLLAMEPSTQGYGARSSGSSLVGAQ